MHSTLIRFVSVLLLLLCARVLHAQNFRVYPPEMYAGANVITISASAGIASIQMRSGGTWVPIASGTATATYKIISAPTFARCAPSARLIVFVRGVNRTAAIQLRVVDCGGDVHFENLETSTRWNVYHEEFGRVPLGTTACHTFRVDVSGGTEFVIDSIRSPSPLFAIRYTGTRPPLRVRGGYRYDVCFRPSRTGRVEMPIFVYIRRPYPAGGYTNYIVADTAFVTVVPSNTPVTTPPPVRPPVTTPPRVPTGPPLVQPVEPPPVPKPTVRQFTVMPLTPAVRAISFTHPTVAGNRMQPINFDSLLAAVPPLPAPEEPVADPTVYRTLVLPNAHALEQGRLAVSSVEGAGLVAYYGATDELTLIGGGAFVPAFIEENVVGTLGARYQVVKEGSLEGAVGVQGAISRSPLSTITVGVGYAGVSYGNDDSRATITAGYTLRHHVSEDTLAGTFNNNGPALSLGGDYRLSRHLKLTAEATVLEGSTYQPLSLGLRWFGRSFAVDLGVLLNARGIGSGQLQPAPLLMGTYVW